MSPHSDINHLLLIAITKYKYLNPLDNCVTDAENLKDILFDKYNFQKENTTLLYNNDATHKAIQDSLVGYVQNLKNTDNLIIYFSGHGAYDSITARGYWCPFAAEAEDYSTQLSNEDLMGYINKIKAKHIVIFSDSCFSRSLLVSEKPKGLDSLYNSASRWALTTGEGIVYDNGYFAESIVSFLNESNKDILISDLIQHVKHKFEINELQTPQGTPLKDPNHKGGEFMFKIDEGSIVDDREFRGYSGFLDVLKAYRPNSKFIELPKFENKSTKIGYSICQEFDDTVQRGSKAINYLYLYQGIYLKPTWSHIHEHHYVEKFKDRALVILLPKERDQTVLDRRINSVKKIFNPNGVFYIDDFILKKCSPPEFINYNEGKFLELPQFIFPTLENIPFIDLKEKSTIESTYIKTWFQTKNEPILILRGIGGIGKTTLAKHFADDLMVHFKNVKTIFIESSKVVDELIQLERRGKKLDFYSFYQILVNTTLDDAGFKLNFQIFKLNFDAGNLLVIIDGLDEIITRIPEFDVEEFIISIHEYTNEIGNGKVIITCRSYFLDSKNYSLDNIRGVDILPFSYIQAENFFANAFKSDKNKVKKALQLAKEFAFADTNYENKDYHPFALDIIRTIIDTPQLLIAKNSASSEFLDQRVQFDYIINSICDREIERVKQLNIRDQIFFFIYLTTKKRGLISKSNFKRELENALGKVIDSSTVEAFKSHTLLSHGPKTFQLRYDFLLDYFNSMYVAHYLKIDGFEENFTPELIEILAENCWYDSSMVRDIRNRSYNWNDDYILKISYLLQNIYTAEFELVEKKRKALSGLFFIALVLNHKFKANNVESNTKLLKDLFSETEIKGLNIINLSSLDIKETIRFDFSGLTFKDCYFDSYDFFWKCNFDEKTFFINCSLFKLSREDLSEMPISKSHFVECKYDGFFDDQFIAVEKKSINLLEQTNIFLRAFFKLFFSNGRLQPQTLDKSHTGTGQFNNLKTEYSKMTLKITEFNKVINLLKAENFIEVYSEYAETKVKICTPHKSDIVKFCNERLPSMNIQALAEKLVELIK